MVFVRFSTYTNLSRKMKQITEFLNKYYNEILTKYIHNMNLMNFNNLFGIYDFCNIFTTSL